MIVYSVITGASSGLGKALAKECAQNGHNLILISLPDEELADIARELSNRYNIKTRYYETDLTESGAVDAFYDWCEQEQFQIDMLINNAGNGSQGKFEFSAPEKFQKMMQLNMNTVASMCWGGLPLLKKHKQSYILNVGSISSFTPLPYKSIYSATKHFVLAFSDSLYYELKESPVFVGCLCPGPIITGDELKAKVKEQGLKAKLFTKNVDDVAREAFAGLLDGERIIIPGFANKLITVLSRILPISWRLKMAASVFSESSFNHSNQ